MAVFFIRHGIDDEGYRGGWSQRGLITEGYRQSQKLGSYLNASHKTFNIHRIVTSDLQRALDTANEIARELKVPLESSNNWRETNNGLIAGMPNEIVNERYPGLSFSGLRMEERYPGGESPLEFYTRIKETLTLLFEEQASKNHAENVLIVTHRGVINVIYHLVKGLAWTNQSNRNFPVSYTSIHRLDYQAGRWTFTIENLTEHL